MSRGLLVIACVVGVATVVGVAMIVRMNERSAPVLNVEVVSRLEDIKWAYDLFCDTNGREPHGFSELVADGYLLSYALLFGNREDEVYERLHRRMLAESAVGSGSAADSGHSREHAADGKCVDRVGDFTLFLGWPGDRENAGRERIIAIAHTSARVGHDYIIYNNGAIGIVIASKRAPIKMDMRTRPLNPFWGR